MIIYLLVKTHNITGLKYLCKTIRKDYDKYPGSGIYWTNHLKIHGKLYTTTLLKECESPQELKEWGLYYSDLWNIVEERDSNGNKTWANMVPEIGDGASSDYIKKLWENPEYRKKQLSSRKIVQESAEYKEKQRLGSKKMWSDPEFRKKRKSQSGENNPKYDKTIYKFQHKSGLIEETTSFNLSKKYNLSPKKVRNLVNNYCVEYREWRLSHNWEAFPKNEWTCELCGKKGKGLGNYKQHKTGSNCKTR